ncbi:hypothetical protein ACFFLS_16530 [Flavobacterium procerum]|uniref:Uncharacterized protein n=1 Tax=Flavobacterium procerum TaxID=1455569 RepID=A0ABV6BVF6_9FLAO
METYQFGNPKVMERFYERIAAKKRNGFVIIEYSEKLPYVVLSKEKKTVNHLLHLFMSCITLGLWLVIWIFLILKFSRKKDILLAVDEDGNLFEDKCLSV